MSRLGRWAALAAGIILGQAILFGPSLAGRKILLPLDLLAQPGHLLPRTAETAAITPHDTILSDLVLSGEVYRQFFARELRAGRLPLWTPFQYAGSPATGSKFSPYRLFDVLFPSPVTLAWEQMILALIAGGGMYAWCRRGLGLGAWPALFAGWCYPLTGFFIVWQGYAPTPVVAWLPWLLLAVEGAARRPLSWAAPGVALLTALAILSGQPDIAAQGLLISGIYGAVRLLTIYWKRWFTRPAVCSAVALGVAWLLGLCLAMPQLLPAVEYSHTGSRMMRRLAGEEERPPVGLSALPLAVLPDFYGRTQAGSLFLARGNRPESASGAFAGLLAALLLAPLAWQSGPQRPMVWLLAALGVLGMAWAVDIPGLVDLLRLPGLNMMSHNRLVFVTALAVVALAAIGLETLRAGRFPWRWWFWLPFGISIALGCWCLFRAAQLPEPLASQLPAAISAGRQVTWITNLSQVDQLQWWFIRMYLVGTLLCGLVAGGWLALWSGRPLRAWLAPLAGTLWLVELLWYAYGVNAQCDPKLYYPPIPALQRVAHSTPGRVIGFQCLPAILAASQGLNDIRGYDAVDPARLVDLVMIAADPRWLREPRIPYALTQWLTPNITGEPPNFRLHPILDMLAVRYVIFRGTPPQSVQPDFSGPDYFVLTNRNALPRVYVPWEVETIADDKDRLDRMANPGFNPAHVAYVEQPVDLPALCEGTAKIVEEIPTRITVSLDMKTRGLVVLADLWDKGWNAYLNGKPAPILRTNHAVRGVLVPVGKATLEFRYESASFAWGLRLAAAGWLATLGWLGASLWLGGVETAVPLPPAPTPPASDAPPQKSKNRRRGRRN